MKRMYLSDREWRELFDAQAGKCAHHWCASTGPFHADHSTPLALKGGKPDQLLCVPCHKAKTCVDLREIARAKRLAGETETQSERRKRLKAEGKHRAIQGRGFSRKPRPRSADEILGEAQ